MTFPVSVPVMSKIARSACAAVAAAVLGVTHVVAAGPWFAGPSVLATSESAAFSGGGFVPGATVQLRTEDPSGAFSLSLLQVAADGSVAIQVTPAAQGMHTLAILDSSGAVLASTAFLSNP